MSTGSLLKKISLTGLFALSILMFALVPAALSLADDAPAGAAVEQAAAQDTAAAAAADEQPASAETPAADDSAVSEAPAAADTAAADNSAADDTAADNTAEDAAATVTSIDPAAVEPADASAQNSAKGLLTVGVVIGILVLSWLLSVLFEKWWKVPESQTRYFIVIVCFLLALVSTVTGLKQHRANLGIDLRGGSILVYGVTPNSIEGEEAKATVSNQEMTELKNALSRRINPAGVKEIAIQELGDNSEVKITIPEADEAEVARTERIINSSGQLKFRILASSDSQDERELIEKAMSSEYKTLHDIRLADPIGKDRNIIGGTWIPIDPTQIGDISRLPGVVIREAPEVTEAAKSEGQTKSYEALGLELTELYNVGGSHMESVREGIGDRGQPEVRFTMNTEGAERMRHLTDRYRAGAERARGRQMAIVLNDSIYSAPEIRGTIDRNGVINLGSDNMSVESRERIQKDVRDLISVMNAGVLPAKLSDHPVTKMVTGPTLGEDTIKKGKDSILYGGILVLIFMIAYYGFAGCVASFAVLMNLLLIMAVMLGLRAAFTLPGLAGLVLTVGMAVDANVLIFERIKEELGGGATLKMAITNGFNRAFTAIFDSNITTMITAVILYVVGTDQVKGFAVTLFFGVAFSMFTATYVSRLIFETCERQNWIGKRCVYPILPGLKPFSKTNIDFVSKQKTVFMIALVFIAVGVVAVFARGKGIFDIDFVGGVEVQAIFDEPQQIGDIRAKLSELPDLSVSNISLSKDRNGNPVPDNCCFTISTSCPVGVDAEAYRLTVENILHDSFGDALRHIVMTAGDVQDHSTEHIAGEDITKVTVGLTVDPPVAREVVTGYFDDIKADFFQSKGIDELQFEAVGHNDPSERDLPFSDWSVAFQTDDEQLAKDFVQVVADTMTGRSTFESSQTIGSSVASYARIQGILAILGSLVCIILYIWFRFKRAVFGIAAVLALCHDVLVTLGLIALSRWLAPILGFAGVSEFKIGLSTVAAFLTIIGYSLNDTIVLFDRMREICGRNQPLDSAVVNKAVNQTLSRTILTSLTTLFVALILYFFGGGGIHTFAFAMSVGVLTGTFSSIFIASPLILWMVGSKN